MGALLLAPSLLAQDLESFAGMRLRFEAPGARAAAMGGTSEALDDGFGQNPAALARIRERRVAIDARRSSSETDYITAGTVGSFTTMSHATRSGGIQAATVILPTRAATFALFADEPLNAAVSTSDLPRGTPGSIVVGFRNGQLVPVTDCPPLYGNVPIEQACALGFSDSPAAIRADTRVSLRRLGGTVALARGPLALGASAQYAHLAERARSYDVENRAGGTRLTWSAGAQWQITPAVRAGASYRSGASFAARRAFDDSHLPNGVRSFDTPSSYGAGFAFDVAPNLTIAIDAARVRYSEMLNGVTPADRISIYTMPDVTELHAGAELRLPTRVPLAVRAGWWRDPSHRIRVKADLPHWLRFTNLMLLDEDQDHVTAGIGIGDRIRLDAAIDQSEQTSRGSLTVATTF